MIDKDIKMHLNWRHIVRVSFLFFVLMIVIPACEDDFNSSIPYARVNLLVDLSRYNELTVPGNSLVFPQGFGGVMITNWGDGFYAVDAACPYEIDPKCVVVSESGIGTCSCCGSQYLLLEGGALLTGTGPSTEPLKNYNVQTANQGTTLIVSN